MKKLYLVSALLVGLNSCVALDPAFAGNTVCGVTGPANYSGPISNSLIFSCAPATGGPGLPVTCIPPQAPNADNTACVTPSPPSSNTVTINGHTLTRLTQGQATYPYPYTKFNYSGPFAQVSSILGGGSWGTYNTRGKPFSIILPSSTFVSFAFVATSSTASLQFAANTTYGDGGWISISPNVGGFTKEQGAICSAVRNGSNNLTIIPKAGYACSVTINQTYYVNIADIDSSGANQCYSGTPTCTSSTISYTSY